MVEVEPAGLAAALLLLLAAAVGAGLVLAANEAFCLLSGYKEEELLSMPLASLQPTTTAGSLIAALQAQQQGSGFSVHEVVRREFNLTDWGLMLVCAIFVLHLTRVIVKDAQSRKGQRSL